MITFKAIVIPNNRRKDGTHPVKIRVTFKGVSRRLPTTLVCKDNDLTRGNKIKNASILSRSDDLINKMRSVVAEFSPFDLDCRDVDWVVSKIKDRLSEQTFHLDFFEWAESFILTKSDTTRPGYRSALNTFARFIGERKLDINAITRSMILDFIDMVDNEPKYVNIRNLGHAIPSSVEKRKGGASSRYVMQLQHIFNAAKERYNDEDSERIAIPKSPFDKIPKKQVIYEGQRNLGQDVMQKIISYQTDKEDVRLCFDAFIVSFCLMGANLVDLYHATPVKNIWEYNRIKTKTRRADKAKMKVFVPDHIEKYLSRLKDFNDHKDTWLPGLRHLGETKGYCQSKINRELKKWCKANGVEEFTFYAARHTWASLARKIGIEKATIDECLAHKGDYEVADIYAERNWELLEEANKKVLDLFTWE